MDVAFSFNEDFKFLVKRLYDDLYVRFKIYYYPEENRPFLSNRLDEVTEKLYSNLPVIFFISEGWLKSKICLSEYEHAQKGGSPVLVVMFEKFDASLTDDVLHLTGLNDKNGINFSYEDLLLYLISWIDNA